MKFQYFFLFALAILTFSCKPTPPSEEGSKDQVKLEGQLSVFTCSDTLLNQRFLEVSENFDSQKDLSTRDWQDLLPYVRPAGTYLNNVSADDLLAVLWADYIQTGNKITVDNSPIWEQDLELTPFRTDSLVQKLLVYEKIQKLAYLAIAVKKDSLAKELFNNSNLIFQEEIKDKFDEEQHSFGKGINVDLLALSLDLIPEDQAKAVVRNIFSNLLESGLSTEAFSPTLDKLLAALTKYDQLDLAYRLLPNVPDQIAAKWMISDLAGIRPSLSNPGFSNPILQPRVFKELSFTETQLKTQYGLLYVRLDRSKPLRIQVRVPAKATLVLPIKDPTKASILANKTRLWMGGSPQPGPPGAKIIDVARDGIIVELARGKYDFQIKKLSHASWATSLTNWPGFIFRREKF